MVDIDQAVFSSVLCTDIDYIQTDLRYIHTFLGMDIYTKISNILVYFGGLCILSILQYIGQSKITIKSQIHPISNLL